jgi:hypothetical protein
MQRNFILSTAPMVLCIALTSCATRSPETPFHIGSFNAVSVPADVRVITERPDPSQSGRPIICSEPSPDVAKAFSSIAALGVNSPRGGIQGAYGQGEAVAALAGRTATAVALRDSLYRACEAYANGMIGRDAYSLILSHYPYLLVTLLLGEAAQGDASIDASVDLSVMTKKVQDTQTRTKGGGPTPASGRAAPGLGSTTDALDESDAVATAVSTSQARPATPKAVRSSSAAAEIARYYFASEEARGKSAQFVVCLSEAEDAIRNSRPFPDMTRNNFIDRMCTSLVK